jgi:hypothetical protein
MASTLPRTEMQFTRGPTSIAAKELWASHLGFAQGRVECSAGLGGNRLPTAPPLPKLGGPDDPGRMVKDWNYCAQRPRQNAASPRLATRVPSARCASPAGLCIHAHPTRPSPLPPSLALADKYRPHANMKSSLNRFGPDFRWPGLNNTPQIRHHLALVKRPKPQEELNPLVWTDLPRMEPGPGMDYIAKRFAADLELDAQRVEGFRHHRATMMQQTADKVARREALQTRAFSEPSAGRWSR